MEELDGADDLLEAEVPEERAKEARGAMIPREKPGFIKKLEELATEGRQHSLYLVGGHVLSGQISVNIGFVTLTETENAAYPGKEHEVLRFIPIRAIAAVSY